MRLFTFVILMIATTTSLFAQPTVLYRSYTSMDYNLDQRSNGLRELGFSRLMNDLTPRFAHPGEWEEITVPIVFHVLYTGTENRVTQQQIDEQMVALNEHFGGEALAPTGDDRDNEGRFTKVKADTKIRFCYPQRGVLGGLFDLVDFLQLPATLPDSLNLLKTSSLGIAPLNTERYLNVWVAPLPDGNSGFAQLPMGEESSDGIMIDPKFFGSSGTAVAPFNEGKTLTHLIGTYLGLMPMWGDAPCADDGIEDTPVHNAPNFGEPSLGHFSTCPNQELEMTMNFMDSGNDNQLHMFTIGQAARMRAVLLEDGPRGGLLETLTECGPPIIFSPVAATANEDDKENLTSVSIYPNPAGDEFMLNLMRGDIRDAIIDVEVFNLKGVNQMVAPPKDMGSSIRFDSSSWPAGIYLIRITTRNGNQCTERVAIK